MNNKEKNIIIYVLITFISLLVLLACVVSRRGDMSEKQDKEQVVLGVHAGSVGDVIPEPEVTAMAIKSKTVTTMSTTPEIVVDNIVDDTITEYTIEETTETETDIEVKDTIEAVETTEVSVVEPEPTEIVDQEEPEPEDELIYMGKFRATAYCSCSRCCGKWSQYNKTASGTTPKQGRTIAVDKRVISLGTTVVINGNEYIAEDTGSGIKGSSIDIYFNSHSEALDFGIQYLDVYIKEGSQ